MKTKKNMKANQYRIVMNTKGEYLSGRDGGGVWLTTPRAEEALLFSASDAEQYDKRAFSLEPVGMTVGEWIQERELSPDGYNPINNDQPVESEYRTRAGDEMIVFGQGTGWVINTVHNGSVFVQGDIQDFLADKNQSDWEILG